MPHPFTAQDYADITQLFSLFGYSFDSAADNGYQWANLYAPDGVFVAGTVVGTMRGRETLAAFAAGRLAFPNGFVTLSPGPGNTSQSARHRAHPDRCRHRSRTGGRNRESLPPERVYRRRRPTVARGGRRVSRPSCAYPGGMALQGELVHRSWRRCAGWRKALPLDLGSAGRRVGRSGRPRKMPALTVSAEDDAAIRQLYARFSHAIDSGTDNGAALSRLFTTDGVFLDTWTNKVYTGAEQLSSLAREGARGKGPTSLNQFVWTIKVEAAPQGASAKAYMMTGTLQDPGKPIVMTNGGQYWDDLVRTADGWRFRKRTFYRSSQTPPPAQTASAER